MCSCFDISSQCTRQLHHAATAWLVQPCRVIGYGTLLPSLRCWLWCCIRSNNLAPRSGNSAGVSSNLSLWSRAEWWGKNSSDGRPNTRWVKCSVAGLPGQLQCFRLSSIRRLQSASSMRSLPEGYHVIRSSEKQLDACWVEQVSHTLPCKIEAEGVAMLQCRVPRFYSM